MYLLAIGESYFSDCNVGGSISKELVIDLKNDEYFTEEETLDKFYQTIVEYIENENLPVPSVEDIKIINSKSGYRSEYDFILDPYNGKLKIEGSVYGRQKRDMRKRLEYTEYRYIIKYNDYALAAISGIVIDSDQIKQIFLWLPHKKSGLKSQIYKNQ